MTDDLIAEIAEKHGVAVGRDDPILILHTLNERLAAENARRHEEQMRAFQAMLDAQAIEASRRLRAAIREESAAAHARLSEASARSRDACHGAMGRRRRAGGLAHHPGCARCRGRVSHKRYLSDSDRYAPNGGKKKAAPLAAERSLHP